MDLLDRIIKQNPFWETGQIEGIAGFKKRLVFNNILKYLGEKQIISLIGMRRVGKTILMHQFIELLLKEKERKNILYFSFDEISARGEDIIEEVLEIYEEQILKRELKDVYIFFDEINHVKDWQVYLKRYYDMNRDIKFFVSGSSSVLLKRAKESLSGRIYEFEITPLSFGEYLYMRGIEVKDPLIQSGTIKRELNRYMVGGSFPEILGETDFEKIKMYVSSVVDKIIFYDIPKVYDVREPEILKGMLDVISQSPGMLINYKTFASSFGITYQTASKYVRYLEMAFLIKRVYNYRGSAIARARKLKKAYLSTPAIAAVFFDFETEFIKAAPKLIENLVCLHIGARFFFREYYEVDFVDGEQVIEVKYRNDPEIKDALDVTRKLKMKKLLVITKEREGEVELNGIEVRFVPAWRFLMG